jgi:hypothetical protein
VADRVITHKEALGDLMVLESLTHQVQHFAFPRRERRDLRLVGIRFLGLLLGLYLLKHMTHDYAVEPGLAGLDFLDGLDEHFGGLIPEQDAQRAAPYSVHVGLGVTKASEDEHTCLPGNRQQIGESIKAVLARHVQVQTIGNIGLNRFAVAPSPTRPPVSVPLDFPTI